MYTGEITNMARITIESSAPFCIFELHPLVLGKKHFAKADNTQCQ
jgi:hypothetical protein